MKTIGEYLKRLFKILINLVVVVDFGPCAGTLSDGRMANSAGFFSWPSARKKTKKQGKASTHTTGIKTRKIKYKIKKWVRSDSPAKAEPSRRKKRNRRDVRIYTL
jgi:hypothetical protein